MLWTKPFWGSKFHILVNKKLPKTPTVSTAMQKKSNKIYLKQHDIAKQLL